MSPIKFSCVTATNAGMAVGVQITIMLDMVNSDLTPRSTLNESLEFELLRFQKEIHER